MTSEYDKMQQRINKIGIKFILMSKLDGMVHSHEWKHAYEGM